ncbi:pilus assembly PilX family protein [Montanilutibacter psychrotolerans]|uniref:Pilus assembly protein n=1 Tax=Montanilutibacter psychrotolerans TaxID=1327343 RepID=A0A3M8SXQ9_9GAMM|nr:PilX N-terminal domain-containing pilus assembly protein [Lysobacter psychrotolerans]RNF86168.1 pilus assembly protein [Lysobacter psychrotolerans]
MNAKSYFRSRGRSAIRAPQQQRGIALVVVLILLLVMTLLGLASLRGTLLEERMSANLFDRSLGFQAAEAALRVAETSLTLPATRSAFPSSGCSNGLCATPDPETAPTPLWQDASFAGWRTVTVDLGDLAVDPSYYIEYMGESPKDFFCDRKRPRQPDCMTPRYRITAQSAGTDRAQVLLQSSYAAQ